MWFYFVLDPAFLYQWKTKWHIHIMIDVPILQIYKKSIWDDWNILIQVIQSDIFIP